jgi:hypothetical protein
MREPPIPIIENGKILNSKELKSYWDERHHQEAITRRYHMAAYHEANQKTELELINERLEWFESMVAAPGALPRRFEHQLNEVRASLNVLMNKRVPVKRQPQLQHETTSNESGRVDVTDTLF